MFLAVDVTAEEEVVPAGLVMTIEDRPARRIYTAKDGYGRGTSAIVQEHVSVCSECLQRLGELIGLGDTLPIRAEAEDARAELTATRQRLQEALTRAEEAEEAVRSMAVFERLAAEPKKATRKAVGQACRATSTAPRAATSRRTRQKAASGRSTGGAMIGWPSRRTSFAS